MSRWARLALVVIIGLLGSAAPSLAQDTPLLTAALAEAADAEASANAQTTAPDAQTAAPARAIEYSDAYRMRAKIHKVASFATLPLFVTEGFLGESLYNDPTESKKTAHLAVATGIGVLFGLNSVTGVWNLVEARHDPNGKAKRWTHGLLMLGADAGFLATAATGPSSHHGLIEGSPSTHRALAFTSISMASAGYLIMLFGGH